MNNIQRLRDFIQDLPEYDEIERIINDIEEDVSDLEEELSDMRKEKEDAEEKVEELEGEIEKLEEFDGDTIFLGLDTIEVRFVSGNIKVKESFDRWVEAVKKRNLASINE